MKERRNKIKEGGKETLTNTIAEMAWAQLERNSSQQLKHSREHLKGIELISSNLETRVSLNMKGTNNLSLNELEWI